jgi:hypothetical protein
MPEIVKTSERLAYLQRQVEELQSRVEKLEHERRPPAKKATPPKVEK